MSSADVVIVGRRSVDSAAYPKPSFLTKLMPGACCMRKIHRWVSVPAIMFLGLIGITGVYLQSDILLEHYFPVQESGGTQSMSMDEAPRLLENSLARIRRSAPGTRIASIELSARGGVPHADVIFADPGGRTQTFDARSGELSAQPVGDPLHESRRLRLRLRAIALELHQGGVIGVAGGWLGWICGLALVTLVMTGFLVYLRLYRQRRRLRRRGLFWQ
jgi:uncharacterized iron-regulated membrane protein